MPKGILDTFASAWSKMATSDANTARATVTPRQTSNKRSRGDDDDDDDYAFRGPVDLFSVPQPNPQGWVGVPTLTPPQFAALEASVVNRTGNLTLAMTERVQYRADLMALVEECKQRIDFMRRVPLADDPLHYAMAFVDVSYGRHVNNQKYPNRLKEVPKGTKQGRPTWLERVARSWLLYLRIRNVELDEGLRSGTIQSEVTNPVAETSKKNIAALIFYTTFAGDNIRPRNNRGQNVRLVDLESQVGTLIYREIVWPVAFLWLHVMQVPVPEPPKDQTKTGDLKRSHTRKVWTDRSAHRFPKAYDNLEKKAGTTIDHDTQQVLNLGLAASRKPLNKLQMFLNITPKSALEYFTKKVDKDGVWSQAFALNLDKYDEQTSRTIPIGMQSGLLWDFAPIAYILIPRMRHKITAARNSRVLGGRWFLADLEYTDAVQKQWDRDVDTWGSFAISKNW